MSTESLRDITLTATVVIFSSNMDLVIGHKHKKFHRIMPPGGKFEPLQDKDILGTALRETREEVWLVLFPGTGVFLDRNARPVSYAEYVETSSFEFPGKKESAIDHLFYFRLHDNSLHFNLENESRGIFFDRKTIQKEEVEIGWLTYGLPFLNIKNAILRVMR